MSNRTVVVLDTNVLLVTLPTHSPYRLIFDQLLAGAIELVVSNEILTEYEEQIAKRYDRDTVDDLLTVMGALPNVRYVVPYFGWQLIPADPDDNKFVDAAIAANVTYLVTNDRHFDVLKAIDFPRVTICTAQKFLQILQGA